MVDIPPEAPPPAPDVAKAGRLRDAQALHTAWPLACIAALSTLAGNPISPAQPKPDAPVAISTDQAAAPCGHPRRSTAQMLAPFLAQRGSS